MFNKDDSFTDMKFANILICWIILQNTSDLQQCWFKLVFIDSKEPKFYQLYFDRNLSTKKHTKKAQFPLIYRYFFPPPPWLHYGTDYVTAVRDSGKSLHYLFVTRAISPASKDSGCGEPWGVERMLSSPTPSVSPPPPHFPCPAWWCASKWSCSVYRDSVSYCN